MCVLGLDENSNCNKTRPYSGEGSAERGGYARQPSSGWRGWGGMQRNNKLFTAWHPSCLRGTRGTG